jgi:uncharacterized protein YutE (UPF0331/DUF86 family)
MMLAALIQREDRLAEITQKVGFALWQLQELEGATAQYFVLVAQARRGMGVTDGNALVKTAQSKTFGKTVSELGKAGLLKPEIQQRFGSLLKERNWLVHNSRASNRSAVHSDLAMWKLLVRLNSIAEESDALLKELGALAEMHVKQHGVSEQEIAERTNRLLQEWQTSDAS